VVAEFGVWSVESLRIRGGVRETASPIFAAMPNLVKDIIIDGIPYTVLFQKIVSPTGTKYFVSAYHNNIADQVSFEMKQETSGSWRVISPAPAWAMENQPILSRMIEDARARHRNS